MIKLIRRTLLVGLALALSSCVGVRRYEKETAELKTSLQLQSGLNQVYVKALDELFEKKKAQDEEIDSTNGRLYNLTRAFDKRLADVEAKIAVKPAFGSKPMKPRRATTPEVKK